MNKKVKPDQISLAIGELLSDYGDAVYDAVEASAKSAARSMVSDLRRVTPGSIAKTWRHKAEKRGRVLYKETVYNTNYSLPHLLEHEHPTGKGAGHYPKKRGSATDHTGKIEAVSEKFIEKFLEDLARMIKT